MIFPFFPFWFVDVLGSLLMVLFGLLCVIKAFSLRRMDPDNVIWAYLLWLSMALSFFALSRSIGHIVQHILIATGYKHTWEMLRPYSGSLNTLAFVVGGAVTLFFERIWGIYHRIMRDQESLRDAHDKLIFINRHLDELVRERTRELIASERKYRRLFEDAQEAIIIASPEGNIVDINTAGLRLFGHERKDIIGEIRLEDLFQSSEEFQRFLEKIKQDGYVTNWECVLQKPRNGEKLVVLISGSREEYGERYVLWLRDISQRKILERQLLNADKLSSIGRLAAGIAHEINNPLGIILGYTQLLLRSEPPDSERYEDLKTIEKHVRMCKNIVGDLLKFSRMTPTERQLTDIHSVIEEVLAMLHHQFERSNIVVEKDFDRSIPEFSLDVSKMKQVFINILINARDAIGDKKGGQIFIRTKRQQSQDSVLIQIEDNGCGIPPEHLGKIFEPFFTTKPPGKGTGLGLAVSYGIVAEHGGDIMVESTESKGAIFTIVLPLRH
ncbi:MAG: ATP-binding protein [Thermodesulforhabdaceae bacterium]